MTLSFGHQQCHSSTCRQCVEPLIELTPPPPPPPFRSILESKTGSDEWVRFPGSVPSPPALGNALLSHTRPAGKWAWQLSFLCGEQWWGRPVPSSGARRFPVHGLCRLTGEPRSSEQTFVSYEGRLTVFRGYVLLFDTLPRRLNRLFSDSSHRHSIFLKNHKTRNYSIFLSWGSKSTVHELGWTVQKQRHTISKPVE